MSMNFNNLAITSTNRAMTSAMGAMFNTLQGKLANGGRDSNCKFYYNAGAGGSILQVAAKSVVKGAVADLKDAAVNEFNSLLKGKKKPKDLVFPDEPSKQSAEKIKYGKMVLDNGTIYALDDWGGIATEALMLGVKLDHNVTYKQSYPIYSTKKITTPKGTLYKEQEPEQKVFTVTSKTLVWYDTTAIVTVDSEKNLIATRVQGRDYSRKELVSNGDIKFSVSGQITSREPDIYPDDEIKKFFKVMQYKGIVEVNNMVLNELGVTHIVIQSFNITPKQGYKSLVSYSFSAIGLQPENEVDVKQDTVTIIAQKKIDEEKSDDSEWMKMLNNQLDGLKSMASDMFSQGAALATGMLDNAL